VTKVIDASGYGNAEGFYNSEIAIRSGRTNSATTLALCRRRCRSRVLDGPRCDGGDIAERSFPRSEFKRSRRHDVSGLAIHRPSTTNISSRLVINIARRLLSSTQCIAMCRSCGVRTFMSTMTPRWRAAGRRDFQRKWVAFFRRAALRPQALPRRRSRLAAGLAPASRRMANVLRKPALPCKSQS
jgi:hypothetical protein